MDPFLWRGSLGILRIVTALLFLEHGTQKLLGFPASEFSPEMFSLPWVAGVLEIVGGVLLILGLFTRPVAFVLSGQMAVAYWIAQAPRSFFPVENGGDGAILFCFVFLYLVFSGPGGMESRWDDAEGTNFRTAVNPKLTIGIEPPSCCSEHGKQIRRTLQASIFPMAIGYRAVSNKYLITASIR